MMPFKPKPRLPRDFDAAEYLIINQDVKLSGQDPSKHYLRHGRREGRNYKLTQLVPDDFISAEYKLLNQDVSYSETPAEVHYYYHGKAEGRRYKLLRTDTQIANSQFDPQWYIEEYPEILLYTSDPHEHYIKFGRYEGRHPRFDEDWYREEYKSYISNWAGPLIDHYRQVGKNECLHPNFDHYWYATSYPDVVNSTLDPLLHYQQLGKREGRDPAFSRTWYEDQFRSRISSGGDSFNHYMTEGKAHGLAPAFNHDWYVTEYPDVLATDLMPYSHYLRYGKAAGYSPSAANVKRAYHARVSNFPEAYDSRYEAKQEFAVESLEVKAIAFYLPQFHRVRENDQWWGEGFTEWTNTSSAKPLFSDHYQPRIPHRDIGYYDLSSPEALRQQSELAKQFGIHAFCFYHYWFSGTRLLEKPLDNLLEHKDIDQKFMICWANESWTRTWDGTENDVLIAQQYRKEDPLAFIKDAEKYLSDSRYVKIGDSPVLLVYKPQVIPHVGDVFAEWRRYWSSKYKTRLLIWCVRTDLSDMNFDRLDADFDGIVEFPPHIVPHTRHLPRYHMQQSLAGVNVEGNFYDYAKLVEDITSGLDYHEAPRKPFYRSVMLGWDNTARRKQGQSIWYGFSVDLYEKWLKFVVNYTQSQLPGSNRFCFINAWNEWAEGTYLEPDAETGYAALNATARGLCNIDKEDLPTPLTSKNHASALPKSKVLVHIHAYYPEDIRPLLETFSKLISSIDIVITTDSLDKSTQIDGIASKYNINKQIIVRVVANLGRDVGPMILGVKDLIKKYDIVGHFHTKRSPTVEWGKFWCAYLWNNLAGSPEHVTQIIDMLSSDRNIGVVKAPAYPLIAPHVSWGDVKSRCYLLLSKIGIQSRLPSTPSFPVGNMFWIRTEALRPLLDYNWKVEDFEKEYDQVSGTLAHCIERIWEYVAAFRHFKTIEVIRARNDSAHLNVKAGTRRICLYVHYNSNNIVADCDMEFLRRCKNHFDDIVMISNSLIPSSERKLLEFYTTKIIVRANSGLDFAAWRDAIRTIGWDHIQKYDEVVLANNSCYGPIFPLDAAFNNMNDPEIDFWGITAFPQLVNSSRPEAVYLPNRTIARHLQSYWLAFSRRVVSSVEFYRFFEEIKDKDDFMEVVAHYETRLTEVLSSAGFKWAAYVPDAEYLQIERSDDPRYNAPYNNPYELLLLGTPLIKKRSQDYSHANAVLARRLCDKIGDFPAYLIRLKD